MFYIFTEKKKRELRFTAPPDFVLSVVTHLAYHFITRVTSVGVPEALHSFMVCHHLGFAVFRSDRIMMIF